ncbi:MAG TPA: crotonase/enoyl-CoA hydratase family protein [Burkholderiales bacterium]|nr:crotonase/enoyl-CoA hydratase family protein [Burkholderiales bacterium]
MNAPVDFGAIEGMFQKQYRQIEVRFDPDLAAAWTYMKPFGAPCFNLGMLEELRAHDSAIEASGGRVLHEGDLHQIHYYVGASRVEGIFNLGGNLSNLVQLIRAADRATLVRYAKLCVDNMYPRLCNYNSPMTTISLVQGEALGGGFETALASNVIIAERRSQMGLPEILFNLFPGNGAYSLLARRLGARKAEEMILSGRVYSAAQLHDMGVVDVLAENGDGESAVRAYIRSNERRRNGMQAMFECRRHLNPISYDELLNIANIWVDAALRVEEKDLKLMSRLGRSQIRRTENPVLEAPAGGLRFAMA